MPAALAMPCAGGLMSRSMASFLISVTRVTMRVTAAGLSGRALAWGVLDKSCLTKAPHATKMLVIWVAISSRSGQSITANGGTFRIVDAVSGNGADESPCHAQMWAELIKD